MKLTDAQRKALKQLHDAESINYRPGLTPGAYLDRRTGAVLERNGLATAQDSSHWYPRYRITSKGEEVLATPPEPPKGPGRPRQHTDAAGKQWAYRQRKEQRLDDLQKYVSRGRQSENSEIRYLCDCIYAGDGQTILQNLVKYIKGNQE